MTLILPGMGADNRMYSGPWRNLTGCRFADWPDYRGEASIGELADRLIELHGVQSGDILAGSSLGGIVACEIANRVRPKELVLIGSAARREEINGLLAALRPLVPLAPVEFIQRAAGKAPSELFQMFAAADPQFIRAICAAVFEWKGLSEDVPRPFRIHGANDRVIPPPAKNERNRLIEGAGHLVAMTRAAECVEAMKRFLGLDE